MISPQIEAREQAKTLDLLRFALDREGVSRDSYVIAKAGDKFNADDRVCLVPENGSWQIFYEERGLRRTISRHDSLGDAVRTFFDELTNPMSFYRYREQWEAETGQAFSMMP